MKKLIIAFKLLFIWSCSQPEQKSVEQEPYPSKDSLLQLADEVIEYILEKETIKKSELDSLSQTLLNSQDASSQQILQMAHEIQSNRAENEDYQQQLNAYKTRAIVTKDCVIYDTVKKNYYITDTLYDTVRIEIIDERQERRKRRRRKD